VQTERSTLLEVVGAFATEVGVFVLWHFLDLIPSWFAYSAFAGLVVIWLVVYLRYKPTSHSLTIEPIGMTPTKTFNPVQFIHQGWWENRDGSFVDDKMRVGDIIQGEFEVRFGILRVTSIGADAPDCRARVTFTERVPTGKDTWTDFQSQGGYLNWYSLSAREALQANPRRFNVAGMDTIRDPENRAGINSLLKNPSENLTQDDPKDLQLFYVLKSGRVFLCTELEDQITIMLGGVESGQPLKKVVEVTFTAQRTGKVVKKYEIMISAWDDFTIKELS
jgi:hypothetical protein